MQILLQNMARGHQKIQSQAKAQEKAAKMKKQSGHSANDQKKAAQKALVISCAVCKVSDAIQMVLFYCIHMVYFVFYCDFAVTDARSKNV